MLANERVIQTGENQYQVVYGSDNQLVVEFEQRAEYQEYLSKQEGRPVYKNADYIKITVPGVRQSTIERKVKMESDEKSPSDPERFPRQWTAFQNQQKQVVDGTPLEEWPPLTKAQIMEMKMANIHTVEALANLADVHLHSLGMGARELREKASNWLANAKGGAVLSKMEARLEELENANQTLKNQLAMIGKEDYDSVNQASMTPSVRKGRPPKITE